MPKLAAIKELAVDKPVNIALSPPTKVVKSKTFMISLGYKKLPDHVIEIGTNVEVSTFAPVCSHALPRINICILLTSVIIFVIALNAVHNQMIQLKDTILINKNKVEQAIKAYDGLKHNLEELARCCYEITRSKRIKRLPLVEFEVVSTVGYDEMTTFFTNVTKSSLESELVTLTDSDQKFINQSIGLPEHDQVQLQKDIISNGNQEDHTMLAVGSDKNPFLVNSDSEDNDTSQDDFDNPRSGRAKRSNGRGICAIHFMGAKPEIVIRDGGMVAPWFPDDSAAGTFGLWNQGVNLREGSGVVELTDAGLYYIYAQIYYLTSERTNSYLIKLRRQNNIEVSVASCSVNAALSSTGDSTEVTCFTSIVYYLNAGDHIFVQQQERGRLLLMRDGQTFLGLVRLHGEKVPHKRPKV